MDRGYQEPAIEEKIDMCIMHLKLCCEMKGEAKGTMEFRKFYSGYLRNLPNVSQFRMELMGMKEFDAIAEKLLGFRESLTEISTRINAN
jgi:tRNA-dihydrouridine synthase B